VALNVTDDWWFKKESHGKSLALSPESFSVQRAGARLRQCVSGRLVTQRQESRTKLTENHSTQRRQPQASFLKNHTELLRCWLSESVREGKEKRYGLRETRGSQDGQCFLFVS
jgi:hypothetical protein